MRLGGVWRSCLVLFGIFRFYSLLVMRMLDTRVFWDVMGWVIWVWDKAVMGYWVGYEDFDEGEDISWDELADGILEVYTRRVTPLNIIYNLIASAFLTIVLLRIVGSGQLHVYVLRSSVKITWF